MGQYYEAFVAFDVAKLKHAVAVAEGGRSGEARSLGEIENRPATIELTIRRTSGRLARESSALGANLAYAQVGGMLSVRNILLYWSMKAAASGDSGTRFET